MKRRNVTRMIGQLDGRFSELQLVDKNILIQNIEGHFINGLFIECTGSKVFLYRFIWPLFYKEFETSFSYSEKISSSAFSYEELTSKEVETELVHQITINKSLLLESNQSILDNFLLRIKMSFWSSPDLVDTG